MARAYKTQFGAPPSTKRPDPEVPVCVWHDPWTGECCWHMGTHGIGPPLRPKLDWYCAEHLPPAWSEKR